MILSRGLDADQTCQVFKSFEDLFAYPQAVDRQGNALDCWRALHRARTMAWIDFQEHIDSESYQDNVINMEEFIHYSRWNLNL